MPIYEYFCNACQTQSEINHRMSDPPATICPVCGKPELTKQISAAAFRLKGGGWYETDFKSGSDTKRNLVEGGSDSSAKADKPAEKAAAPAAPAVSSTS